jgi:hypothetical protein
MNLQENIERIQLMMGVINEDNKRDKILKMINDIGLSSTIKFFGGYDEIKNMDFDITREDKIKYIKEKVAYVAEGIGSQGFPLDLLNEEPIFYNEDEYSKQQIEYLHIDSVYVDVYDKQTERFTNDMNIRYQRLPLNVLDEIFEMLIRRFK